MTRSLSGEQVAILAGISPSAVSKLKSAADPLHRVAGGYDCAAVGRWLYRRALASIGRGDGNALDLSREQALLARARREALEFEAEIRKGKYLEAAYSLDAGWRAGLTTRDGMLSVPGRIAARLVGMDDEREIERLLTEEIRAELTRLARTVLPDAA